MARLSRRATSLVLAALVAAACGGATRAPERPSASAPGEVSSNVVFSDYAGTQACAPCHADRVASWLRSPMHNMTRDADGADVRAPFDGTTFTFKGDTAKLETIGGARFVTVSSKKLGSAKYRVTRVIGGHYREDFAGIAEGGGDEVVLPVSWVFATQSLRYKGYSVMVKERVGLRAGPVWNQTCIFCHNTPPYLSTVLGAIAGPAAKAYQGEVVDPLLPKEKRAAFEVTDDAALSRALEGELSRIGVKRKSPSALDAVTATRRAFRREHLVEVGIGCEACHLGSAEHVRDPKKLPTFEPKSAFLTVRLPPPANEAKGALRAARINRICARCHQVLFSGYEPTWEGGSRHGVAGGSHINSGEARDMLLGACTSKLSCVECHEPHADGATAALQRLGAAQQDALCTRCHERYAAADALRAHAHHDPAGEGARCLSCHMPKKNLSLDGGMTRYHRIGSPTDPPRVLLDRPVECALCHADRSVESLVSTMEAWWKRAYDREALRKLYGDLEQPVALATADRGKPHEQAVAFHLLGASRSKAAIPALARHLTHPYPLVRGYAKRALDAIAGAPVPVDIDADEAEIEAQTRRWLAAPH
ncbi:MAG: hypothetical protein KF819_17395 [Labilithrix sp.]|nr:hypothetical protein [Labilithrix sp.]